MSLRSRKKLPKWKLTYERLCKLYVVGKPARILDSTRSSVLRYARVVHTLYVSNNGWQYPCEVRVEEHGEVLVFDDLVYRGKALQSSMESHSPELESTHTLHGSRGSVLLLPMIEIKETK